MIDPSLVMDARRLLDRARVVAEASASQPGMIGRRHPTSKAPAGAFTYQASTLQAIGGRVNTAIERDSDPDLRSAINWGTHELRMLQQGPERSAETPAEFRDRVCRDYEGVLAGVVARKEMTSVTTVRKFRQEAGRDPRTGYKLKAVAK